MNKKTLIVSATLIAVVAIGGAYKVSNANSNGKFMRMSQGMGMGQHKMGMGRGMRRGQMGMGQNRQDGDHRGNMVRHRTVRFQGLPAEYANVQNPLAASAENITAGKTLFADNCVSCHGEKGLGDGEAGKELSPKPANLSMIMDKWIATDGFLNWSISDGGEKLKTDMPAFKDALSDKERWQVITYLKNGLNK